MPSWRSTLHVGYVFTRSLCAFYVLNKYGLFMSKVSGPSMYPTFGGQGDIVVVEAISRYMNRIAAGDVVICMRPVDPAENVIKRVLAVQNEWVVLYPDQQCDDIRRIQVPIGHVWIQGDNPTHSLDSRQYGPVPLALVKGRVLWQIWPRFKSIA